jgi:hypothetical protein
MKDNLLLKCIDLSLPKELQPFLVGTNYSITDDNVIITFNLTTKIVKNGQMDDATIDNDLISDLATNPNFVNTDVVANSCIVTFSNPEPLLREISDCLNNTSGEITLPHSEAVINEKKAMIETIQDQIKNSRSQADSWEEALNKKHLVELAELEDENKKVTKSLKEASKKGLI